MSKITKTTWKSTLAEAVAAVCNARNLLQEVCLFAMNQAGNGNYTYINEVIQSDLKGMDAKAVQNYFEGHCDVTMVSKGGKYVFSNNKTRGFKYVAPEKKWWEYKPTAEVKVIDPVTSLLQAVMRIERALKHEGTATIAKGKAKLAKELVTYVKKQPDVFKAAQAKAAS